MRDKNKAAVVAMLVAATSFVATVAYAEPTPARASTKPTAGDAYAEPPGAAPAEGPPPSSLRYLQYGVSFTAELAAVSGAFCTSPASFGIPLLSSTGSQQALPPGACALGSGGGITGHIGVRSAGPWYFGGAYEFSKQDPSKLLRLAILQQLRFESRYYVVSRWDTQPFVSGSLGLAAYGEEWQVGTWGVTASIGGGIESQVSSGPVVGVAIAYRPIYLQKLDTSVATIGPGFAHMFSIDLTLEAKDPF